MANQTEVKEIILVGFPGLKVEFYIPVTLVLLLIYMASLSANGTVISLVIMKKRLHKPMYVIIANLAFADLLFDTVTLPKLIAKYWFGSTMTFPECLLQMFLVHFLNTTDSYIFVLMAVDRYFAICKPLRYPTIITSRVVAMSCCTCWVVASSTALTALVMNSQAPPCGYNKINTIMCTNIAVTALACKDVSLIKKTTFVFAMFIQFVPLSLITLSYIIIINIIRLSASSETWRKAFYTCSTHLFAVTVHYAPRVLVYTANEVGLVLNADVGVFVLCLYSYVPHISNPIIYCLRNKDIKETFMNSAARFMSHRVKSNFLPNTVTK
ncbi:PREDICTED: olfactory receptor 2AT4-like [Nanorana parkeri]|uniref:olfactory receptor 2AT4-like n=1 Tax=Nanorana parkeri TaxID=125878 RepID=UPI0008550896|nr:PREDICTED: olfactory receptor 2AT4-like [Nanorana parkeri]